MYICISIYIYKYIQNYIVSESLSNCTAYHMDDSAAPTSQK